MRAIQIHGYGGPEVMRLEEIPVPHPGSGQVLVRIQMASVNFLDIQKRRGELTSQAFYAGMGSEFPATLGTQGVGIVEAIGPDVNETPLHVGERVVVFGETYADFALAPAAHLIPVPSGLSLEQAAAGLNQGFIAYVLTHLAYPVHSGDWCVVQAAAGGIGHLVCQMAKLRGGRVIGVTSTQDKAPAVREAGVDEVIISSQDDIVAEVRRITVGGGVQVVYDGVGKDTFEASLDSLAPHGYLVIYGQSSGFIPPFDLMRLQEKGSLFITRNNASFYREAFPTYLERFVTWVTSGQLFAKVDRIYPLGEAAKAHQAVERRSVSGRILLRASP